MYCDACLLNGSPTSTVYMSSSETEDAFVVLCYKCSDLCELI